MKHNLVSLLLLALAHGAGAGETIVVGAEDDWPPYSSIVGKEAQGFAVDVVREAYAQVGITVRFEVLPYTRCMAETKAGHLIACFDAIPNGLIVKSYLWPRLPLFTTHSNIYGPASSTEHGLTARDLEGKTVGVERGYEYGDQFDLDTKIERKIVDKNVQGFLMLQAGRIQYMAVEGRVANAVFAAHPDFGATIKLVGTVDTPDVYLAFSKTTPDAAKYLAKFNEGYAVLHASPRYKELEAQWFR